MPGVFRVLGEVRQGRSSRTEPGHPPIDRRAPNVWRRLDRRLWAWTSPAPREGRALRSRHGPPSAPVSRSPWTRPSSCGSTFRFGGRSGRRSGPTATDPSSSSGSGAGRGIVRSTDGASAPLSATAPTPKTLRARSRFSAACCCLLLRPGRHKPEEPCPVWRHSATGTDTGVDAPMAFAALEMAVADAHLRVEGRSFAEVLGVAGAERPGGSRRPGPPVGGRPGGRNRLVGRGGVFEGQAQDRTRVGPRAGGGRGVARHATAAPFLIQVDANGTYREQDADHLAGLDRYPLLCVEQPLPPGDLEAHARLARHLATPVCLDEDLDSPSTVRRAVTGGACSVVCLKPAHLGGLAAALETVSWCTASATPLWLGGMFESGYARGVNTALAALPGFSWPGDLSPAPSYLAEDLVSAATRRPAGRGRRAGGPRPDSARHGSRSGGGGVRRRCVRRLDVVVPGP